MASSAASSSHRVFLSFRGEDTRYNFTGHLLEALKGKGLDVLFDIKEKLEKGKEFSQALSDAISASNLSIVVLSKGYASSKSCLTELSVIMDSKRTPVPVVLPIFYNVDPSHVREIVGIFKTSFEKHESKSRSVDEVNRWRSAFAEVGKLKGWRIEGGKFDRTEIEHIKDIVESVIQKLMMKHQVFLSFGEDTRHNFTSHLLKALKDEGISFFFDEEKVENREQLSPALSQAIAASILSIIVLSKDYASSKSCLAELYDIMDCKRTQGHIVLPIFYHVDPFETSFEENESKWPLDEVERRKSAFVEIGKLEGWRTHTVGGKFDRPETEYIKEVVECVTEKLKNSNSASASKELGGVVDHKKTISSVIGGTTHDDAICKEVSLKLEDGYLQNASWKIEKQRRESSTASSSVRCRRVRNFFGSFKAGSIIRMEEDDNNLHRTASFGDGMSESILVSALSYVHDPRDRAAISLVCRRWYELESLSRKHITIAFCYAITTDRLQRRFPFLESLKLKGKPWAAMFNLIPDDWGGYVTPWVREIAENFDCLRSLHFRRMIVRDSDLKVLARSRGRVLQALKLDKCSGFSTDGLFHIGSMCRQLRTLFLEESSIIERDGKWLHEIAMNNYVLETLNFYMTDLFRVSFKDLEQIARNCSNLTSVKVSDCEILDLVGFFRTASVLEEFCGGSFNEQSDRYNVVRFPPKLCRLGLTYIGSHEMPIVFPFASSLKKLDLLYALLDTEDHCLLIKRCPNLEVFETRNVIGDTGLEVLAQSCKKLKRLRIERGADEQLMGDEEGVVSHRGLTALAQGCLELEYIAIYVSNITNASLESVGTYSKNLSDFRLVLLDGEERITDLPLDNGVRALLRGCEKLRRFALYLRPGGLTDVGLGYIGRYSPNVRWMLLGYVGDSDNGLLEFSKGCPSLQKLEMRDCYFSERALAYAALQLPSLRYLWVQGYEASSQSGRDLLAMARPFWNIELIPARRVITTNQLGHKVPQHPAHILAYYSLAGPRTDFPDTVVPLAPVL
ncbi:Coronatine-insensitive protein 1 [Hibiscus syriacus]|uniref:ADP-ribosyl cyclase/cyclic ADP-ribose hydrolase n=1 Tax=Hibiscus syriacus TaxID=106335 RepID=A0A6A2Y1V5_HIBSY|nr:coronatine-insensitive protein 1-like [Hibiscus syriacus]KAE8669316.1 Coronatine-insensitive protein 1 [Hibiscus syriacus]